MPRQRVIRGADRDMLPHPGETLAEAIENHGMTPEQLAAKVGWPLPKLQAVLDGEGYITLDLAHRLEDVFGARADFWIGLQGNYEEELIEITNREMFAGQQEDAAEISPDIGAFLAEARGSTPLSTVAQRCGLDKGYLSRVERGERRPKLESMQKLAEGYGVPERVLLWRIMQENELDSSPAAQLEALLAGLHRDDQLTVLRTAQAMFGDPPEEGDDKSESA